MKESINFCIVIFCHKKDYFLAKILVGSIRYYYPEIKIYLCKDLLKGAFDTSEMEKSWQVEVLDLGIQNFGWSAAKMHFYLSKELPGKKVLLLDADIVFTGNVLDRLIPLAMENDVVVSPSYYYKNEGAWLKKQFYDVDIVQKMHPDFTLPGYYFNCGQIIARSNLFTKEEVELVFNDKKFPYWLDLKQFPLVDQAVLNYLLPYKEQKKEITIAKDEYYIWIDTDIAREMSVREVLEGKEYPYMLHWAGNERIPFIYGMVRGDILVFFQNYYYTKIPKPFWKKSIPIIFGAPDFFIRYTYRWLRKKYQTIKAK